MSTQEQERFSANAPSHPVPTSGEIRAALAKILRSDPFVRSERIKKLLEFLVESALAGQRDLLKESLIGIEVFERSPAYDSKQDPIVRVEMRRLRSKLSEYYLQEGSTDEVRIWLEKGSYIPNLSKRAPHVPAPAPPTLSLSADINLKIDPNAIEPANVSLSPDKLDRRSPHLLWIVLAVIVVAVSGTVAVFLMRGPGPDRPLRTVPLAGNAGLEMSPSFSPDNKQVAYAWDGNRRNFDIYIKPLAGAAPRRLTDNAAHDIDPAWSPDGSQIALLRVSPDKTEVLILPSTGGVEKVIANLATSPSRWHPEEPENNGAAGPVWSPNGSYLLVAASLGNDRLIRILKIYLDGKEEALTTPGSGAIDTTPRISPSGDFIAFTRNWSADSFDLYVMSSRGGNPVRLTSDRSYIQGLAWLDDHNLTYSSNRVGNLRLWQISRSGGDSSPVSVGGAQPQWPAVSRDGRRLAFVEPVSEASIWRLPLNPKERSSEAEPFISSAGQDHSPAYSSDGKKLAFVSDRSGTSQIWTADSDGSNQTQLTNFKASSLGSPRWSANGRRIVFDGATTGQPAIWLIDADGNNLHRLNSSTEGQYLPSWSRDGHWVYFCSIGNTDSGLWKQDPDSGQAMELTKQTFFDAAESSDGRTLYVQRPRGGTWQLPSTGGIPQPVPELAAIDSGRYWTMLGDTIYFVRQDKQPHQLESFNLASRKFQKLATIAAPLLVGTPGLSISPKDDSILFVQRDHRRSSIMLQER